MGKLQVRLMFIMLSMGFILMMGTVSAFTHVVGGSYGWRVPQNKTYYEDWAKPRTFGVGDILIFPSLPSANNVVEVNKEDYDACTFRNVIRMYFSGPIIVNLTKTGDFYYYNGHGKHCEIGQKLHIKVGDQPGSSGNLYAFKLIPKEVADAPIIIQSKSSSRNAASSLAPTLRFPNCTKVFCLLAFFVLVFVI